MESVRRNDGSFMIAFIYIWICSLSFYITDQYRWVGVWIFMQGNWYHVLLFESSIGTMRWDEWIALKLPGYQVNGLKRMSEGSVVDLQYPYGVVTQIIIWPTKLTQIIIWISFSTIPTYCATGLKRDACCLAQSWLPQRLFPLFLTVAKSKNPLIPLLAHSEIYPQGYENAYLSTILIRKLKHPKYVYDR